jgi:hypothetical protein
MNINPQGNQMSESSENTDETRMDGNHGDGGRFASGNRAAIGNRGGRPSNEARNAFTKEDLAKGRQAVMRIIDNPDSKEMAVIQAVKFMYELVYGKPASTDFAERIDGIEGKLESLLQSMGEQLERVA